MHNTMNSACPGKRGTNHAPYFPGPGRLPLACSVLLFLSGADHLRAQSGPALTTIYTFAGSNDGGQPNGELAVGPGGVLYGTTQDDTIFELKPPAGPDGTWTFKLLYEFLGGSDGFSPEAGVTIGAGGVLYGTTAGGGTSDGGTVYSLTPPASAGGPWIHTVLYSFSGPDGWGPTAAPVAGAGGVLYGTTAQGGIDNYGVVYSLAPPASAGGAWAQTLLHEFNLANGDGYTPSTGLTIGDGVLYGTASGLPGTVYALVPPASAGATWTFRVLLAFECETGGFCDGAGPDSNLTIGTGGVLYSSTSYPNYGQCVVFSLTPPAAPGDAWIETVLQSIHESRANFIPLGNIVFEDGTLYLTGTGGGGGNGVAEALVPPSSPGGAWTPRRLYTFTGGDDGSEPQGLVLSAGVLYGTTSLGGSGTCGCGTVFALKP